MMIKLLYLFFIIIIPFNVHSQDELKNEVSQFMEDKFKLHKYREFEFSRIDWKDEFNPDSIGSFDDFQFDPDAIIIDNTLTNDTFDKDIEKTVKSNFSFTITDSQWKTINDIPLIKDSYSKLIESRINNRNRILIKYKKPKNKSVSFKQLAIQSMTEDSVKTSSKIQQQSDFIKKFNKVPSQKKFISKPVTYVPLF